ncbi:hypothetical protein NKH77_40395 [Streptomyces sp. M19]
MTEPYLETAYDGLTVSYTAELDGGGDTFGRAYARSWRSTSGRWTGSSSGAPGRASSASRCWRAACAARSTSAR